MTASDSAKTTANSLPDWDRLKEIVSDALELPTVERGPFLDRACAGNVPLRDEAASLVELSEKDAGEADSCVLHPRVDSFMGLSGPDPSALAGKRFGKYELSRLLGEGGMAAVYLAKQDGMERLVALKVLRPHALGYDAHRRFGREVAAHGRIDHPGVARIIDAGVERDPSLPGSRPVPYIAMEYVDGLPLTKWAAHHKLPLEDRLRLLADVADAVHAAHQKAIVHRDLKPGNVLVCDDGKYGRPKVLDFGIARILQKSDEGELASGVAARARTLQTTTGALLGTLGYMAPEQARGGEGVDVRSDVWALGVMLHELVTGRMPVPVIGMPLTEALRRLSEPDITAASIGEIEGGSDTADLRAILTTALAAEPSRRYASAEALADDLRRLLRHEPVTAHLPTRNYLLRKFVRRHRTGVAAAALVVMALVGGATAATVGFVREAAARQEAVDSEQAAIDARDAAERALLIAEAQHLRSQAARGFLNRVLEAADVDSAEGAPDLTLLEAIRAAEPELPRFVQGDVVVESDVRLTLARALRSLGETRDSDQQYELAINASRLAKDPVTGEPLKLLWPTELLFERSQSLANQNLVGEARPLYEEARRQLDAWPEKESDNWKRVDLEAEKALATLLEAEGDYAAAAAIWETLIPRAETLLDKADQPNPVLGVTADELSTMRNNAGSAMLYAGRIDDAIAHFEETIDYRSERYGPDHPVTLRAMNNLANAFDAAGRLDEVEAIARQVIAKGSEALGPDHELVRSGRGTLISVLIQRQSPSALAEAIELSDALIEGLARRGRDRTTDMLIARNSRAITLTHLNRAAEAAAAFSEATELGTQLLGEDHPFVLSARGNLGRALADAGDVEAGAAQMRQVLEIQRRVLGDNNQSTVITRNNLAMLAVEAGDAAGAIESARELAQCVRIAVERGWEGTRPIFQRNYGRALLLTGEFEAAEAQLLAAHEALGALGETQQRKAADHLVKLYEALKKPGAAAEWRVKATPPTTAPEPDLVPPQDRQPFGERGG